MDNSATEAMPLRIAILTQSAEILSLSGDKLPSIETVLLMDDFEASLQKAIQLVTQGRLVKLSIPAEPNAAFSEANDGQPVLLMLSGLMAAQNKIHPHAYLSAFNVGAVGATTECVKGALAQARRQQADLSNQQTFRSSTAKQKFMALHSMVEAIAGRDIGSDSADISTHNYWFTEPHKARVTSVTFESESISSSLVLTQATGLKMARSLLSSSRLFFIVTGKNETELSSYLTRLSGQLNADSTRSDYLIDLMIENLKQFQARASRSPAELAIVLQATSVRALLQEIKAIGDALPKLMVDKSHYKTPAGSCFSSSPNSKGGVTFVYPGVGTVYPGMLRDFYQYFPELYSRLEREGNLKEILQSDKIYGNNSTEMSLSELAIAGVGSSYLLTQLLCNEFAIRPDFALGYSKGEASMWASLGVWKNPHALIEMTKTSPIFTSAISGELTAVREAWHLSDNEEIIWNSFVVRSDAASIELLLPEFPHVYLAIIQGDTCVIAGCEQACRRLLKKLGKRGIAANRVTAMHTPPALSQHKQVTAFYRQPLCDELPKHIRFISAASLLPQNQDQPINMDSQSIADSIADTYCSTLNFTALVQNAREHGARLFVEVGADRQTCTLIDKINRVDNVTNEHGTVATNAKGGEDILTLLKCIGQLVSHQIPLSLDPLLKGLEQVRATSETTLEGEPA